MILCKLSTCNKKEPCEFLKDCKSLELDGDFMLFTMKKWKSDFRKDCKKLQYVDNKVFTTFLECLPPKLYNKKLFQVGEKYSYNEKGEATYTSFIYDNNINFWLYVGEYSTRELIELEKTL